MFIKSTSVNGSYFENIDTRNKAYYLGLLASDGNIVKKTGRVNINLQERDANTLQKLKDDIGYTGKLGYWNKKPPRQNQRALCIHSAKLVQDLERWGIKEGKTHELIIHDSIFKSPFTIDFLRGFFDGDGWISLTKNRKSVTFGIICLESIALQIMEYLSNISIEGRIDYWKEDRYSIKELRKVIVGKKKDIFILMSMMYEGADIFIERKYEKYKKAFIEDKLHLYETYCTNKYTLSSGTTAVLKLDIEGNIIEEYESGNKAAKYNDLTQAGLWNQCELYKKKSYYRIKNVEYLWCKKQDYDPNYKLIRKITVKKELKDLRKPVLQIDVNNNIVRKWISITSVKELNFDPSAVTKCCKGKIPAYKGFTWKYE